MSKLYAEISSSIETGTHRFEACSNSMSHMSSVQEHDLQIRMNG
ncbi:hypothetical protein [Cognaticolwellia mytili]|nr:hypothetical protein [Cognaticolwellia mytili]